MRKLISLSILILSICGFLFHDAQAKRFGGGRSFGVQRTINQYTRPVSNLAASQPLSSPLSSAKKWLAPLAGLALGGLLASLFMGHGLGSGILSWLMIGSIIFLLFHLIKKKIQPAMQNLTQTNNYTENNHAASSASMFSSTQPVQEVFQGNHSSSHAYPSGFNADEFLREAKSKFIRLQLAYDRKNMDDLREFTTPEVFAEIQLQLHERGNIENNTEVIQLEAELLDATTEFQIQVASVRFIGSIREDSNNPTHLDETWHFRKNQKNIWLVSGIQQQ